VEISYRIFRESQQLFLTTHDLLNRSDEAHSIDQANKVALIAVAVPAAEGEILVVVGQHSVDEPLNIIPAVRHAEGEELTVVTRYGGILNLDLVGSDRSNVHCGNILQYPTQNLKHFL